MKELSATQRKLLLNSACGKLHSIGIAACENMLRNVVLPHLSAQVTVYSSGNLYNGICYIYKNNEGVWRKYSPLTGWVDMNINALKAVLRYWKYNKCPVYTVNNFKEKFL